MQAESADGARTSSFEAYADAYRSIKDVDAASQLDSESGAALQYADVCADRARLAADADVGEVARDWDVEQSTWTLIQLLFA